MRGGPGKRVSPRERSDDPAIRKILDLIQTITRTDFKGYKLSTLFRRIARRMALQGFTDPAVYQRHLRKNAGELRALSRELLIHVTGFFRDPEAFEFLKRRALPQIIQKRQRFRSRTRDDAGGRADAPLRIWIDACSSGEEAYSVAICAIEALGKAVSPRSIQIFATDADELAIAQARAGVYPPSIRGAVSPRRLARHFVRTPQGYRVADPLRQLCIFAVQDMTRDPPFAHMDLVTCRNLLIYLDAPLQKNLLRIFHFALRPHGVLMLGRSENVHAFPEGFAVLERKQSFFRRQAVSPHEPLSWHFTPAEPAAAFLRDPLADSSAPAGKLPHGKKRVAALRDELTATRERLQAIIEEQTATNEELHTTLEESQASNEELEAASEELRCTTTELQRANESLRDARDWLELAQRAANAGSWDWNLATGKLAWSKEFFDLFGVPPATTPSFVTWRAVVHPADRETAERQIQQSVCDRTPLAQEYRIIRPDGKELWIGARGRIFHDATGKPLRMCGICIDITERKRAEDALRKSEERFKTIASNTPDHLIVQDRELRYELVVNPQLGLTEQDMIGKTDHDFLSKDDADQLTRIKRQVLETGQAAHMEFPLISTKGEKEFFDGSYVPRLDAKGQVDGLIGYFRNVTERKRVEEVLRQTAEAAAEAGHLQERVLQARSTRAAQHLRVFFQPKHQAGGDFINAFDLDENRFLVVVGDASGHDLPAAFLTAYFQGLVRAMVKDGKPVAEILDCANDILFREWNDPSGTPLLSLDLAFILADRKAAKITVLANGLPPPVYVDSRGRTFRPVEGSSPLGWFAERAPSATRFAMDEGSALYVWTDGLEDFAAQRTIDSCAVAHRLYHMNPGERDALLKRFDDDVLLAAIHFPPEGGRSAPWHPILRRCHNGDHTDTIDAMQSYWENSLSFALRETIAERLDQILIALREVALNAMKHGCRHDPHRSWMIQAAFQSATRTLRVRVTNPGAPFDLHATESANESDDRPLIEKRYGLVLVKHYADQVTTAHEGDEFVVTLDFTLK